MRAESMGLATTPSARRLVLIDDATPDRARRLSELVEAADGSVIALDIEEDREFGYNPRVALVQVTVGDVDYVIDPVLAPYEEIAPAIEALSIMPAAVVLHGCRNDVVGLKRDFGIAPTVVCDTQLAARFVGLEAFGLAALVKQHFGVDLDKELRRSNWLDRPMSAAQIDYARQDTQHLVALWETLSAAVDAAGWSDALEEECDAMAALEPPASEYDPDGWRSMKGIRELEPAQLARVPALWAWRDRAAATVDRHPSRVVPPWALLQLARHGVRALERSDRAVPVRLSDQMRAELERALEHTTPPPRAKRANGSGAAQRPGDFEARLQRLCRWRDEVAAQSGLDPGFLAPRSLLEALASLRAPDPATVDAVPNVRRWRTSRWTRAWLDALGAR